MSGNLIDEYKESMGQVKFSDETKEQMVRSLMKISSIQNGGAMKKRFGIKKAVIIAAACVMAIGGTAFAYNGIVASRYASNRIGSETTSFGDIAKLEKEAGVDIAAVEAFSNGYKFKDMYIMDMGDADEDENEIRSYAGINVTYEKAGCPDVFLDISPNFGEESGTEDAQKTREVDGITLKYSVDEYLFLPPSSEGNVPEEDLKRQEEDNHFFISFGSEERETVFYTNVVFVMDGNTYILATDDTKLSADEIFGMAEEIIAAR